MIAPTAVRCGNAAVDDELVQQIAECSVAALDSRYGRSTFGSGELRCPLPDVRDGDHRRLDDVRRLRGAAMSRMLALALVAIAACGGFSTIDGHVTAILRTSGFLWRQFELGDVTNHQLGLGGSSLRIRSEHAMNHQRSLTVRAADRDHAIFTRSHVSRSRSSQLFVPCTFLET